jgi:hypothetical protein
MVAWVCSIWKNPLSCPLMAMEFSQCLFYFNKEVLKYKQSAPYEKQPVLGKTQSATQVYCFEVLML